MDFSKIISISGKPGLYQLVNQSRNGIVVESLLDGKKLSVSSAQQVSTLADITIYTDSGDLPLEEVFKKFHIARDGAKVEVDLKDKEALQEFLFSALPEYDEDRVYPSDIRKMVKWYNTITDREPGAFKPAAEDEVNGDTPAAGDAPDEGDGGADVTEVKDASAKDVGTEG